VALKKNRKGRNREGSKGVGEEKISACLPWRGRIKKPKDALSNVVQQEIGVKRHGNSVPARGKITKNHTSDKFASKKKKKTKERSEPEPPGGETRQVIGEAFYPSISLKRESGAQDTEMSAGQTWPASGPRAKGQGGLPDNLGLAVIKPRKKQPKKKVCKRIIS